LPKTLTQAMKPKDVYFEAGYYELNVPCVEAARAAGGKSVIALCHAPVALLTPAPDILIDAQWQYGDGALTLPGYDVPMLPTSGVLQMAVLWTTVGRVNALLAGGR
jgi:uncharacterized phosphosugar-binding protein